MAAACGGGLRRELEVVVASWCPWLSSPVATGILDHSISPTTQDRVLPFTSKPLPLATVRMKLSLPSVSRLGSGRWTETQGGRSQRRRNR